MELLLAALLILALILLVRSYSGNDRPKPRTTSSATTATIGSWDGGTTKKKQGRLPKSEYFEDTDDEDDFEEIDLPDWKQLYPWGNTNARLFEDLGEAVVIDVETTGVNPKKDRIVSIAMMKVDFTELEIGDRQSCLSLYGKYNPGVPIPQAASNVHGIYDQDVKGCSSFADDAQQIRDFIGDLPLVAHNAAFDKAFLSQELQRAGVRPGRRKSYCTMRRFQTSEYQRGSLAGCSLENVADLLGIGERTSNKHDAMEDVTLTAKIAAVFVEVDRSYRS